MRMLRGCRHAHRKGWGRPAVPCGNARRVGWEDEGVKPPEVVFPCRLKRQWSIVGAEKPSFPAGTITPGCAKKWFFSCQKEIRIFGRYTRTDDQTAPASRTDRGVTRRSSQVTRPAHNTQLMAT